MTSFSSQKGFAYHRRPILAILICLPLLTIVSAAIYPEEDWPLWTPEAQGMRSHVLAEMMAHIVDRSFHIDSILIARNGHVVLEAYFWPITTLAVSAYKDGKVVCVSAHPWHSPYNAVPIVQRLKFK